MTPSLNSHNPGADPCTVYLLSESMPYLLNYSTSFKCTGFPGGSEVKVSACNVGDLGSIRGSERSPREGNGNPLQYSCLENPMDGGAWWATVHGVAKSRTQLSDFTSLSQSVRTLFLTLQAHSLYHRFNEDFIHSCLFLSPMILRKLE